MEQGDRKGAPGKPPVDWRAKPTTEQAVGGAAPAPAPKFTGMTNIEEIRDLLEAFCIEREWHMFHSPRYLLLELLKNTGQLAELFQQPGLENPGENFHGKGGLNQEDKNRLGEMIAETQMSLLRLSDVSGIDLGIAIRDKLQKNEIKYPVEKYRGRTDLADENALNAGGKRKRFSDAQLRALTDLADSANWSLLSVPKEDCDKFCRDNDITKDRLHNFFNNRKPKDLKRVRGGGRMTDRDDNDDAEM